MDKLVAPDNSSSFVGNRLAVSSLRKWLEGIVKDPKTPKRVCYLTGPVGSGKSTLARLLLKEHGFVLREFESVELRTKATRDVLIQTMGFRDILALLGKLNCIAARKEESSDDKKNTKEFRKAVLVDDFENMGLATQEVYRGIRDLFRRKKTIGVPVIFTGNKVFKGKRPLAGHSVFIHLKARSNKENLDVIRHFLKVLIKKTDSPALKKISKNMKEQLKLAKECGGDVRRVLKHLETMAHDKSMVQHVPMEIHEKRGPLHALWRIMNVDKSRDIDGVLQDIEIEGMTIPFGLHWAYLHYVPWRILKARKNGSRAVCSRLWRDISAQIADYGMILDKERNSGFWGIREVGNIISCWGFRVKIKEALESKEEKSDIVSGDVRFHGRDYWWVGLEKGTRQGDSSVETPCMNKTLRASLTTYQLQNLSFQMINQGTGTSRSWKPGTNRRTIELLRLCPPDSPAFTSRERLSKLTNISE